MAPVTRNVSEDHSPISTFLDLKRLDAKSFVCESLWLPAGERGVYGGQLIAQSLLAATRSVGTHFTVNSIHCHFLSRADPLAPISYSVKPMREGKTYCTMMVEGRQNERWVVSTVCSFQRPELDQPLHQPIMPPNIPSPDLCPNYEVVLKEKAAKPETTCDMRQALLAHVEQLTGFPIEVKTAGSHPAADNLSQDIFWMRLRAMPTHSISFKKCALAFVSDFHILSTVSRAVGLVRGGTPPNRLSMISSLDHSVWFYDEDFDLAEWVMFVTISPLVGMGRGIVNGRIYTQSGRLIAIVSQEGVVRAGPVGLPKASTKL